jgi:multiple sugar transport system substrate-binding protein
MRKNLIVFVFIVIISLIFGSIIYYFAGLNNKEAVKLSGKINVLVDSNNYQAVSEAAVNFSKIHTRVEINLIKEDDVYKKISEDIKSKKISEDITVVPEEYTKPLIKLADSPFLDLTQDISGMKESFPKGKIETLTENNKIYGIPWTSEPIIIIYRSDIFSKEGINVDDIKTWDDFRIIGKSLTQSTGAKFLVYNSGEFDKLDRALLSQLRISYSDKEKSQRVSDLINGMTSEGILYPSNSVLSLVKKGGVLAVFAKPSDAVSIMEGAAELKGKWSAIKLPAFEPGGNRDVSLGGYNLLINKNTKNINLSKGFAEYLSSDTDEAYINLNKYGKFSAAYSLYDKLKFNDTIEYFNINIWSFFGSVEKNSPENEYK